MVVTEDRALKFVDSEFGSDTCSGTHAGIMHASSRRKRGSGFRDDVISVFFQVRREETEAWRR